MVNVTVTLSRLIHLCSCLAVWKCVYMWGKVFVVQFCVEAGWGVSRPGWGSDPTSHTLSVESETHTNKIHKGQKSVSSLFFLGGFFSYLMTVIKYVHFWTSHNLSSLTWSSSNSNASSGAVLSSRKWAMSRAKFCIQHIILTSLFLKSQQIPFMLFQPSLFFPHSHCFTCPYLLTAQS